MNLDHEQWLRQQGVKITGRHTLRRGHLPSYTNWASERDSLANSEREDGRIDWSEQFTTTTEQVYQVELDERTIERFERTESDIKHALETANRRSNSPGYRGPIGPNDISDFYIKNRERHFELLQENSMYRDAWREFQSIRVLIGETPHWP